MGIFSIILEDFKTQREGVFSQGFWALLVYRLSHPRINCQMKALRVPWRIVNIFAQKIIEITTGISLPEATSIGRRLTIEHFGGIVLHGDVVIGDDCMIRQGVTIGNSGVNDPRGAPVVGNNVHIGAGAKLIGRISIGENVLIGANAVVIRDVPANSVAVGVPAVIKNRF